MILYDLPFIMLRMIRKDPGMIVGPLSKLFGFLLDLVYQFVSFIVENNTLGISIILLTIFIRCLMLPIAFKQQKSMQIMRKIQPDIQKIQDKYKNPDNDPEIARKMNMEIQKLYSQHKYNPFSGCLPMLIQLPIFISIYYIMQFPYQFIGSIRELYEQIAVNLQAYPNFAEVVVPIATPFVPKSMTIDIANVQDFCKILNMLTPADFDAIAEGLGGFTPELTELINQKHSVETFFGLNLVEIVGYSFPKILIPILSGVTTYLSSWIMTRRTPATNERMIRQQKTMNIIMPLFMAWITTSIPCGVGIYWITSNVFQVIQILVLYKIFDAKEEKENNVLIEEPKKKNGGKTK